MKRAARPELLSPHEWRKAIAQGKNAGVSLPVAGVFKAAKDGGPVSFIASTATEDRYGDVIEQAGWDLAAFKANPVLLWAHSYSQPPVGRVPDMVVENGALTAKAVEFTPASANPFGAQVEEMVRGGFLNACSVGFLPKKWEYRSDEDGQMLGIRFLEQELLELSVTPVPANAEALVSARSFFAKGLEATDDSTVQGRQVRAGLEVMLRSDPKCSCAADCAACSAGSCAKDCKSCEVCAAGDCPMQPAKDASDFASMLAMLERIEKNTGRTAASTERQEAMVRALHARATSAEAQEALTAALRKQFA